MAVQKGQHQQVMAEFFPVATVLLISSVPCAGHVGSLVLLERRGTFPDALSGATGTWKEWLRACAAQRGHMTGQKLGWSAAAEEVCAPSLPRDAEGLSWRALHSVPGWHSHRTVGDTVLCPASHKQAGQSPSCLTGRQAASQAQAPGLPSDPRLMPMPG